MTDPYPELTNLRRPFDATDVKQRQGPGGKKLDYVAIETVLNRLLVDAPDYDWYAAAPHIVRRDWEDAEGERKYAYDVVVSGTLKIGKKQGAGFGAMTHTDLDMAIKSANSEAMKNAAKNGFGVGLELWDAEYRAGLEQGRKLAAGDLNALKGEVFKRYRAATEGERIQGAAPTADDVADYYNVRVADLNDTAILKEILDRA